LSLQAGFLRDDGTVNDHRRPEATDESERVKALDPIASPAPSSNRDG
jgi:hypothetical protein